MNLGAIVAHNTTKLVCVPVSNEHKYTPTPDNWVIVVILTDTDNCYTPVNECSQILVCDICERLPFAADHTLAWEAYVPLLIRIWKKNAPRHRSWL